jgi:hypothetical protein
MMRRDLLVADTVAVICQCEALGIVGRQFNIPVLRRLPLVTHVCGRYAFAERVVLGGIALHIALSRS